MLDVSPIMVLDSWNGVSVQYTCVSKKPKRRLIPGVEHLLRALAPKLHRVCLMPRKRCRAPDFVRLNPFRHVPGLGWLIEFLLEASVLYDYSEPTSLLGTVLTIPQTWRVSMWPNVDS